MPCGLRIRRRCRSGAGSAFQAPNPHLAKELLLQPQQGGCPGRDGPPDAGLRQDPRTGSRLGSSHSPSGRVNSRKVGSETTVWETVCTGSSTQATSLGRQDLMQRTVSVFSWRSLRRATAREGWDAWNQDTHRDRAPGPGEKQLAGQQHPPQAGSAMGLPAQLLRGDASGSFYKSDWESNPRDTPQFPTAPAKISEVLLFTSCTN